MVETKLAFSAPWGDSHRKMLRSITNARAPTTPNAVSSFIRMRRELRTWVRSDAILDSAMTGTGYLGHPPCVRAVRDPLAWSNGREGARSGRFRMPSCGPAEVLTHEFSCREGALPSPVRCLDHRLRPPVRT